VRCAAGPAEGRWAGVERVHRGRVTEPLCGACRRWGRGECARRQAEQVLRALGA